MRNHRRESFIVNYLNLNLTAYTHLWIRFSCVGESGVLCILGYPALILYPPVKPGVTLLPPRRAPGVADLEPFRGVSYHHYCVIRLQIQVGWFHFIAGSITFLLRESPWKNIGVEHRKILNYTYIPTLAILVRVQTPFVDLECIDDPHSDCNRSYSYSVS